VAGAMRAGAQPSYRAAQSNLEVNGASPSMKQPQHYQAAAQVGGDI